MLRPTDEQSLAQAETRIHVNGPQVLTCISFSDSWRTVLQECIQAHSAEDVVIYDRFDRAIPVLQDAYVPDAGDFPLRACVKERPSRALREAKVRVCESPCRTSDVENPPSSSPNTNALAVMVEPSWRHRLAPSVQEGRRAEKPARIQIPFTWAVTAVISCSVFLSCAAMFLPLEHFTQSIRSHAMTSCSSARQIQTRLIDEIVVGNVSEVAPTGLLDSISTKIKDSIIVPADRAVESVLGHMVARKKFNVNSSSLNSAAWRREVGIRAWAEMSSQCGGGKSCSLSGIYVASDSGAFAGFSVQPPTDPPLPSPTGLLWDAPAGGSPVSSRKTDLTTGRREGATELQGSVHLEEAFRAQQEHSEDAPVARSWSRVSMLEDGGSAMFWTAPVAYCKKYSCMEGVVAAEVSLAAEIKKSIEEELNALFFKSGLTMPTRNASSILLINQVSGSFPEQQGLQIAQVPSDDKQNKEGLADMASRAILRQFGSWSNASLLETKPRLVRNFSSAAVSSGAADLHCTPLQRRGFQSDCYLVATSSINMDARTRWLVVAVLHSGIFTGSAVEVENEVDQKVASFEKSTIESLEEGRARGLYVLLVMTLLSVATSLLVGRMVAGPLRHLTDLMDKLSELDFEPENALSRGARRSYIQDVAELEIAFGRLARGIGMFARFVPETVVRNIVSQGDDFATRLKVDRRVVTVMCTDIAGFTSITELLVLRDLYFILTRYFSVMMSVVEIYQGVVSEILGDGLIVLWNAPDHVADHATAACAAALTQQQALCHVNDELKVLELTPLSIRIGIHTGSSLLGNIGSMTKMKYGCLGETKQLAIRLEEHCKYYEVDVICSSDTKNAIPPGKFFMRWLGKVKVRSDDEEMVGVHEVISRENLEEESIISPTASVRGDEEASVERCLSYPSLCSGESASPTSPGLSIQRLPSIRPERRDPQRRQAMKRWLRYLNAMAHEEEQAAGVAGPAVDDALASERSAGQLVEMVARGRIRDRDVVTPQQRRHVGLYESALKAFFSGKYSECIASAQLLLDEKDDVPAKRLAEAAGRLKAQGTDPRRPNLTAL
mmetsp:Transcript_107345/g.256400  ORF Transcript_107345/g.256400 Transcript_107345/m.256400 type:complete len:1065 (+) Transcript_107345:49-3243(+)|eukprot:CAMPEP_0181425674 /NCGR_PEP_ID=MMETSP1110-20121109/15279_1 /TAXON_ID=174948 /ORGANISM="Symbiodinium sp., Strain CCMP421" /LENGTH=1064 /DNA_ID=CAMNT_0023548865 /DNA_START=49 /DNA_END=3243 /DNA_ORIENTATION=-